MPPRRQKEDILFAKLDVRLLGHPKMVRATGREPSSFELYVRALLWSKQFETDGVIPFEALAMLGFRADPMPAARALVTEKLWHEFPDGFGVNDYDRYQTTKRDRNALATKRQRAANVRWSRERQRRKEAAKALQETAAAQLQIGMQVHMQNDARDRDRDREEKNNHKPTSSRRSTPSLELVDEVWQAYARHHPRARLTTEGKGNRRDIIRRALRSHPPGELVAAIDGIHESEYHVDNGYAADLGLTLRDADHIEKYAAMASENGHVAGESRLARARRVQSERDEAQR
jgi:hypothetical protein